MKKFLILSFFLIGYIVIILAVGSMATLESYKGVDPFEDRFQEIACYISGYVLSHQMFSANPVKAMLLLWVMLFLWGFVSGRLFSGKGVRS